MRSEVCARDVVDRSVGVRAVYGCPTLCAAPPLYEYVFVIIIFIICRRPADIFVYTDCHSKVSNPTGTHLIEQDVL